MAEYFEDTFDRRRDFRAIGLNYYKDGEIVRLPIDNSVALLLHRIPYDYFNEYLDIYFSSENKQDLKKNKINNFISLISYYKGL